MATISHLRKAVLVAVALVAASLATSATPHRTPPWALPSEDLDGHAPHVADSMRPTVHAAFARQSYRQGGVARLVFFDTASKVTVRVMRAGTNPKRVLANDLLTGSPVTAARSLGSVRPGRSVTIGLDDWPSGVYYAELKAAGSRVGYAPFVLGPRTLGQHDLAVVEPTQTWQAYNFRDDDGDGAPDTWYWSGNHARLARPFLNRGVPNHFKVYDLPLLQWLYLTHRDVDVLSDADLNGTSGRRLRAAYKLIVFPGHHEYVTEHEYDAIVDYRNRGGHLMWLSANNFFWKVTIDHDVMTRVAKWRELGKPEATADMTYYELPSGAKAFAAGAFSLAVGIRNPQVERLVTNVWDALSR